MAISVADNFSYLGTKPLDARLSFDSVSAMASASEATLYDGCFAYVKATQKYYSYDSTNTSDPTTGKWREYSSGGGGGTSDYSDLTNKPSINGVELLGNKTVGLLSTNIQINADKIGYSGTVGGASTAKEAIDSLNSMASTLVNKVSYSEVTLQLTGGGWPSGAKFWLSGKYADYEGETETSRQHFIVKYCDNYNIMVGSDLSTATKIGEIKVNRIGEKFQTFILNSGNTNYATVTVTTNDQTLVGKAIEVMAGSQVVSKFVFDDELSYTFKTNIQTQHDVIYRRTVDDSSPVTATVTPSSYGQTYAVSIATANPKVFPHVTTSTTDITAGTTALTTGDLYLVYE